LPFQELLIKEIHKAHEKNYNNAVMPYYILKNGECQCLFSRKYLLPCSHYFYLDIYGGEDVLTDEYWNYCISSFAECGLDVYKSMEKVSVPETEEEQNIDRDRLNIYGKMESMKEIFWRVKDNKNDTLMQYMDNHLGTIIEYLNRQISGNLAIE
jgi:hypothetical protein